MRCRYCGAWNHEEGERCTKCQRRLYLEMAHPVIETATAPQVAPQTAPQQAPPRPRVVAARADARRMATQPSLFPHLPQEKVLPLTKSERAPRHPANRRRSVSTQTSFHFEPEGPPRPALTAELNAAHARVPVAPLSLRAMSAACDTALVLAYSGLFLLTLQAMSRWVLGANLFTKSTLPYLLTALAIIGVFYKLMYSVTGATSPGIRGAGLRLVNFEGAEPTQGQRLLRFSCGWVSSLACGVGLLWALADQERLTWHDHVSQTFLTPVRR